MVRVAGCVRFAGIALTLLLAASVSAPARAQDNTEGFVTGAAANAFEKWQAAMLSILDRQADKSEASFGELLAQNPSPMRIALLADHTIKRTAAGGAVLLLEQDAEAGTLQENGKKVAEMLATGREQMNEADDGFYFASIGRFDIADANFRALLASDVDPVALLEFTDQVRRRRDILVQLLDNQTMGESARGILKLLATGERDIKADPTRVRQNIDRLIGPPRAVENALDALKESGEYAIPWLIQYLRDPSKRALTPIILRILPKLDRPGLNPLVIALKTDDQTIRREIIRALGQIGYAQALPYLLEIAQDNAASVEMREAAASAISELAGKGLAIRTDTSAADAFYQLAESYYRNIPSLAADPRLDTANVWYWREGVLQNVEVPTQIFDDIMCMRCCEEALMLQDNHVPAQALWVAANFRREAQLGEGQTDPTRKPDNPPGIYYAQSAGTEVCLRALERAVDDRDPAVALGAIEALRRIAGPASLGSLGDGRSPLAEALSFPDRVVRIRAALALGAARPQKMFDNYQNLMPVLSEALMLHAGARNALVVDADADSANLVAGVLRGAGYDVITDAGLFTGLQKVREQSPGLDLVFLATDMQQPPLSDGLAALRKEFRFAAIPVVLIVKAGDRDTAEQRARSDPRIATVPAGAAQDQIAAAAEAALKSTGTQAVTPELGTSLALEAAQVLRKLADARNPVFQVESCEPALLVALQSKDVELRRIVAEVLGYIGTQKAQEAIAAIALNAGEAEDMRVLMFNSLAEAAKRTGNQLGDGVVKQLVDVAEKDANLTIREAASRALGALNLPGGPGSLIIRNQSAG